MQFNNEREKNNLKPKQYAKYFENDKNPDSLPKSKIKTKCEVYREIFFTSAFSSVTTVTR